MTPTPPGSAATDDFDLEEEFEETTETTETSFAQPGTPILRTAGVGPGAPCPRCGTALEIDRGVLYDTVGRTTDPIVVLRCRINGHTFRETPLPAPRR